MGQSFKKLYTNKKDFIAYKDQIYHKNKKSSVMVWRFKFRYGAVLKLNIFQIFLKKIGLTFLGLIILVMENLQKKFNNCVISDWLNNGIKIMDQIIDNEVILIGSSMGGWISTLVSLKRRKKVKRFNSDCTSIRYDRKPNVEKIFIERKKIN